MTTWQSDELSIAGLARLGPANRCDLEAIGRSEAVQPHGVLLGIAPDTLRVEVVSANLPELLGVPTEEALGLPLERVLGADSTRVVAGLRDVARLDDVTPLELRMPGRPGGPRPVAAAFDLVAYRADGLLVVELEPADRRESDLVRFYELFRRALTRLRGIDDLQQLCEVGVEQLRLLAGYDRVMVYRFDADATGRVVAEAGADGRAYLGVSFPAGDIPRQARALYLRNWFRQIADVEHRPVPLRRLGAIPGAPIDRLDLSLASLRSIAPAHLQYLRNMGVRASASVSLIVEDQLWGLLACHHHSPKWIPPYVRVACETLGRLLSLQIGVAQDRARAARAAELATLSATVEEVLADAPVLAEAASRVPAALLGMVGADGVVLRLEGTIATLGVTPPPAALGALVNAVAGLAGDRRWHTHHLASHLPDHDPRSSGAAGALYLPLGPPDGDFALWLRTERLEPMTWGGRPPDKNLADPDAELTPRSSFDRWHEVRSGTSSPWTPMELTAAAAFGRAMPEIQLHRTQRELAHLALHDSLTGLPNRTMFLDRVGHALARSNALGRTALMFIDIDRFKSVNDTLGHQAGDALLRQAAGRLRAGIRETDTAGRMGGDEFVVLCEDLDRPRDALDIANRIIEGFRRPFVLDGSEWRVTVSIGLAMLEERPAGTDFLRQADLALYQAKQAGRDQVVVFDRALSDTLQLAIRTERELADAVRLGELVVFYQPVNDLRPGPDGHPPDLPAHPPYGLEALIRWAHPTRGLLSPAEFLPYAEDNALGDAIGDQVLSMVLTQLADWRRTVPAAEALRVAVNVTVRQLTGPRFAERILEQLAAHGVPPGRISLELTETQLMSDPDRTIGALRLLDAAGVRVVIDDFGTGFSSLAYVRDLPADSLKVDRSFVVGLPDDTRDVAVVTAVIGLAHELGMTTVAEGVETTEQLECLRQLGCDFAQGFLLGRPVPAAELRLGR